MLEACKYTLVLQPELVDMGHISGSTRMLNRLPEIYWIELLSPSPFYSMFYVATLMKKVIKRCFGIDDGIETES